jgi:hypothetical protein
MDNLHLIKIELNLLHEWITAISRRFEEIMGHSNHDHELIEELRNINQLAHQLVESDQLLMNIYPIVHLKLTLISSIYELGLKLYVYKSISVS